MVYTLIACKYIVLDHYTCVSPTNKCRNDVGELFPVSKIEMEVKAQKDSIYGSTNFHDQYYAVSKRLISISSAFGGRLLSYS